MNAVTTAHPVAVLFMSSLVCSGHAWAPATHPDPTSLLKALELTKKAWQFPKPESLHYTVFIEQSEGKQTRQHPWSSKYEEPVWNDTDDYYFDGYTPVAFKWPTQKTFLASLPIQNTRTASNVDRGASVNNGEECDDYYYDHSGDVLCWATNIPAKAHARVDETTRVQEGASETQKCKHGYYDRIGGEELCWLSFTDRGQTVAAHKFMVQHPRFPDDDDDNCPNPYYDDTGNKMCWA